MTPGDAKIADWDRVVAVAGDLMQPAGLFPERFRVTMFPSDEQIAAMDTKVPEAV